jgi:hypothetical protein
VKPMSQTKPIGWGGPQPSPLSRLYPDPMKPPVKGVTWPVHISIIRPERRQPLGSNPARRHWHVLPWTESRSSHGWDIVNVSGPLTVMNIQRRDAWMTRPRPPSPAPGLKAALVRGGCCVRRMQRAAHAWTWGAVRHAAAHGGQGPRPGVLRHPHLRPCRPPP